MRVEYPPYKIDKYHFVLIGDKIIIFIADTIDLRCMFSA